MSQLVLPTFSPRWQHFCLCVMIEPWDGVAEWFEKNGLDKASAEFHDADGKRWFVEAILEMYAQDAVHLHIELCEGDTTDDSATQVELSSILQSLNEFIGMAAAQEGFAIAHGRLVVPRTEIPEHGLIGKLLNASHQSCGAAMALSGATFNMDDDAFTKMSFSHDAESEEVTVELWAEGFAEVDEELLSSFVELISTGTDCFVFERVSREQANA